MSEYKILGEMTRVGRSSLRVSGRAMGLALIAMLSACSSSGGSGSGYGGSSHWQGEMRTHGGTVIPFQMVLQAKPEDEEDPFPVYDLSGVFTVNVDNPCFSGGTISDGTLDRGAIEFAVTHRGGTASYSGTLSGHRITGNWSNSGSISTEVPSADEDEESEESDEESKTTTETTDCSYSGRFFAN